MMKPKTELRLVCSLKIGDIVFQIDKGEHTEAEKAFKDENGGKVISNKLSGPNLWEVILETSKGETETVYSFGHQYAMILEKKR
jgi:hypothetical protein